MIARSLRVLLEGLFDYSGFAPPAALPMTEAVSNYAKYRGSTDSWMLGRSIVPIAKMAEYEKALATVEHEGKSWRLSALTAGHVLADIEAIHAFNDRQAGQAVIDVVELKADTPDMIRALRPVVPANLKAYVEIPLGGGIAPMVAALAANGLRGKARTGGLTPDAIPSCEQIATFIVACTAARIPYKFTAGMHAPFRSVRALTYAKDSPKAMMHGFVNAFLAAALAYHGGERKLVEEMLGDTAPESFHFDDERALWHDTRLSCEFLESARRNAGVSLGSCSFAEPVESMPSINQF
jgi:hypothetical protein